MSLFSEGPLSCEYCGTVLFCKSLNEYRVLKPLFIEEHMPCIRYKHLYKTFISVIQTKKGGDIYEQNPSIMGTNPKRN
jgi:hypothetical protein